MVTVPWFSYSSAVQTQFKSASRRLAYLQRRRACTSKSTFSSGDEQPIRNSAPQATDTTAEPLQERTMAQQTPPATKGPENASAFSQRLLDMVFNTPRQHRVPPNPQTHCSKGKKTWGSVDPSGPGADTKPWPNPTPPPTLPPSNPHTCTGRTVESTSLGRGSYSVRDGRAIGIGWTLALKRMPTNLFCTIRMRGRHLAEHF